MGSRANFTWAVGSSLWTSVATPADALFSLVTLGESSTLRRIIVDYYVAHQTGVDNLRGHGRAGIIVADPTVVAAGVTAIPKPGTQGDQEWLWNRGYGLHNEVTAGQENSYTPLHLHDDVRAMRRMKQNDELVFVIENFTSGSPVNFMISVRALFST